MSSNIPVSGDGWHFFKPLNASRELLYVREHWPENLHEIIRSKRATGLVLEYWEEEDLSCLDGLGDLITFLQVDSSRFIKDVTAIHQLTNLEELRLGNCVAQIDFRRFPQLRRCSIAGQKPNDTLRECHSLRSLEIYEMRLNDLAVLSGLRGLTDLGLVQVSLLPSLEGISEVKNLESLGMNHVPLQSLNGLEGLKNLKELYLVLMT
jgi:Leucine-rich repeat (LRR) protein